MLYVASQSSRPDSMVKKFYSLLLKYYVQLYTRDHNGDKISRDN